MKQVNNPGPSNSGRSKTPRNYTGPRKAGPPPLKQVEIKQEKQSTVNRKHRRPKNERMQKDVDKLAAKYPHMLRSHLRAALTLTRRDVALSKIILGLSQHFREMKEVGTRALLSAKAARVKKANKNRTRTAGPRPSGGTPSGVPVSAPAPSAPACGITFGIYSGPLCGTFSDTSFGTVTRVPDSTSYSMSPSRNINFYMKNKYKQMGMKAAQKFEASYTVEEETEGVPEKEKPSSSDSSEIVLDETYESTRVAVSEEDIFTNWEDLSITPLDNLNDFLAADLNDPPVPRQSPSLEKDLRGTPPTDKVGIVLIKNNDGYKSFMI